jgi:hypothetical protein
MSGNVPPLPSEMSWLTILLLMACAGAFGGVLDVLRLIDIKDLLSEKAGPRFSWVIQGLLVGAVIGSGGAIAAIFVTGAADKFATVDTVANRLRLVSLGVISGFLGYRLLKSVANQLEKDVNDVKEKTQSQGKELIDVKAKQEKALTDTKKDVDLVEAIGFGFAALGAPNVLESDLNTTVRRLEEARSAFPAHRRVGILLARLYHERLNSTEKAMEILTQVLEAKRQEHSDTDDDAADVLFNRACYSSILAGTQTDQKRGEEFRTKALADLALSVRYKPTNKKDAASDDDLKPLKDDVRFRDLIS